jgi:hypothetical protein
LQYQILDIFDELLSTKTLNIHRKLLSKSDFFENNHLLIIIYFKELVWRRARKGPRLMTHHKLKRLEWCLANQFNDFWNYVFCDETSCWINAIPFYHWRHPATHPNVFDKPVKRLKLNIWAGICKMGASEFVVIVIANFCFKT